VIDASTNGSAPHSGTVKAWLDGYGTNHRQIALKLVHDGVPDVGGPLG
jgi:hypothetical protein